jgi:predicted RNA-binding protein YlqC (UPF0109 family)
MKILLDYIIKNILPKDTNYEIEEQNEGDVVTLIIKTDEKDGGLVIGKGGKIIKAIRNILRIKATLDHKKIVLMVNPVN